MLCLITWKVRSENGYGSFRPGLKTGVGSGFFWSEIGSGFGDAGRTPPPKIPRSTPTGIGRSGALSHISKKYSATFSSTLLLVFVKAISCSQEALRKLQQQREVNKLFNEQYIMALQIRLKSISVHFAGSGSVQNNNTELPKSAEG